MTGAAGTAPATTPCRGSRAGVLVAATTGNALATTATVHAVFGTFLIPLSTEFGWSRASISTVLAIFAIASAIVYPLAGRYADAHGARRMVLTGNVLFALSVAALALTDGNIALFYATFLAIGIFGGLPSTSIFSKLVAEWFRGKPGTALGVSAGLGNGIGSVVMPILAAVLVSTLGWRMGYLGIAAMILCIGFPVFFLLLRDAPGFGQSDAQAAVPTAAEQAEPHVDGMTLRDAARLPRFWLVLVAIASGAGVTTAILSHVVPILLDRGFALATGTAVVSVFALVGSLWQIATGRILDIARGPRVVVPMVALAIPGLLLLEFGGTQATVLLAGVLLGIALGTQFGSLPYLIARYFGLRHFGGILGIMYSAVIAAQGTTPVLLDAAFDTWGSYRFAIVAAALVLVSGCLLLMLLPGYRAGAQKPVAGIAVAH